MTKVLIVDDESPVSEAVKLLGEWERFGMKAVLEAKNGLEAKALIEQERPALTEVGENSPSSKRLGA